MSGRKKIAVKSGMIGMISQITSLILQIISRKVFIQFIGEEVLGLNNTFTSILSTLSLAELGFQNAVSFHLYRPIFEKDEDKINVIVNIYKVVYRALGIFFCVASVLMLPFLKYILKDIIITKDIYFFFMIQAMSSTCTYFLAYKRTILYADQKEYVYKLVDTVMNVLFKLAQIYVIVTYHNYYLYITLQLIQVYVSNVIIHFICGKKYPFLKKDKLDKNYAKKIFSDVKEISVGRIAAYVYSSADNLLISTFLGTIKVAGLGNYTTITNNLRLLVHSILGPITPIIGNYMVDDRKKDQQESKLYVYQHLRYLIALVLLIPTFILIDDFIALWVGTKFILPISIKVLLITDLYFIFLQGASTDYVSAKGLFKQIKYVQGISTIIKLVLSFSLMFRWGITGILFGTACSQIFNFFGYGFITYRYCFKERKWGLSQYFLKNAFYLLSFIIILFTCQFAYQNLKMDLSIIKFIGAGLLCEGIIGALYLILNFKNNDMRELFKMFLPAIKRKLKLK